MNTHVELYNGNKMPLIGLGTGNIQAEEMEAAISTAIELGYRLFDCALLYRNEKFFGEAINKCLDNGRVKREELFISSKLPMIGNHPDRVEKYVRESLDNLQLSYLDMYLIHFPVGFKYHENTDDYFPRENGVLLLDEHTDIISVWRAMESLVDAGLVKSIGVSNFNTEQISRILKICKHQPANNQVEAHVYFQQKHMQVFCSQHNIIMSAFAPLGSLGRKEAFIGAGGLHDILRDPIVLEIAKTHKKTPAQILINFLTSQNVVAIPKSSSLTRLEENFQANSIQLSCDEKAQLLSLDKEESGRTFCFAELFKLDKHPENPMAHP